MKLRILTLLAISAHAALGNVCMMQMAYAEEEPHAMHDMANMPMSSEDCAHCPPGQTSDEKPAEQEIPCAGGHCILEALPQATVIAPIVAPVMPVGLPPTLTYTAPTTDPLLPFSSAGPPGAAIRTTSVVLRC
jgi:hypothetical protein